MRQTILDKLFYGKICGISDIGEIIGENKEAKVIRNKLKKAEMSFFSSKDKQTVKEAERIIGFYRNLLLVNLKEGYKEGIKTGFDLARELELL